MKVRFLDTGYHSAAWNMGLDESILHHVSEGESPATLRLYGWKPAAVSIGYFQSLALEQRNLPAHEYSGYDQHRYKTLHSLLV